VVQLSTLSHLTTLLEDNKIMNKKHLTLSVLLIGLTTREAQSQVYSQVPLLFTNTLTSSSGGSSLLGISLGPNTTVQGGVGFVLNGNSAQIQLKLSDGMTSLNESDSGFTTTYNLTQNVNNNTLTISAASGTPWGGLFQDMVILPPSAMRSDAQSTFQFVVFGSGGRFGLAPGVIYGQYQSVVTISDGTTTGIFNLAPAPEPGTIVLSLMGGLAGLVAFHRRP